MGNIGSIRIKSDSNNVYEVGQVVDLWNFRDDFFMRIGRNDSNLWDYLNGISIPAAAKLMAEKMGIEFEFC